MTSEAGEWVGKGQRYLITDAQYPIHAGNGPRDRTSATLLVRNGTDIISVQIGLRRRSAHRHLHHRLQGWRSLGRRHRERLGLRAPARHRHHPPGRIRPNQRPAPPRRHLSMRRRPAAASFSLAARIVRWTQEPDRQPQPGPAGVGPPERQHLPRAAQAESRRMTEWMSDPGRLAAGLPSILRTILPAM
jgi:hypothetical protein